jgi:hypothetical protein
MLAAAGGMCTYSGEEKEDRARGTQHVAWAKSTGHESESVQKYLAKCFEVSIARPTSGQSTVTRLKREHYLHVFAVPRCLHNFASGKDFALQGQGDLPIPELKTIAGASDKEG